MLGALTLGGPRPDVLSGRRVTRIAGQARSIPGSVLWKRRSRKRAIEYRLRKYRGVPIALMKLGAGAVRNLGEAHSEGVPSHSRWWNSKEEIMLRFSLLTL